MSNFKVNGWGFSYDHPTDALAYFVFFLKEFPTDLEFVWGCFMDVLPEVFIQEELERLFPAVPVYVEEGGKSKRLELVA